MRQHRQKSCNRDKSVSNSSRSARLYNHSHCSLLALYYLHIWTLFSQSWESCPVVLTLVCILCTFSLAAYSFALLIDRLANMHTTHLKFDLQTMFLREHHLKNRWEGENSISPSRPQSENNRKRCFPKHWIIKCC